MALSSVNTFDLEELIDLKVLPKTVRKFPLAGRDKVFFSSILIYKASLTKGAFPFSIAAGPGGRGAFCIRDVKTQARKHAK